MSKKCKALSLIILTTFITTSFSLTNINISATADISSKTKTKISKAIVLSLDNPYGLVKNVKKPLDKDNLTLAPIVVKQRTLVPIRFISENLGAKVTWDQKTNTATINLNGKVVKLIIGNTQMTVGTKTVKLEAPATAYYQRTFVPVRAVSEAFGKKVFYDRGIIAISDTANIIDPVKEKTIVDEMVSWFSGAMPKLTASQIFKAYTDNVVIVNSYDLYGGEWGQGSGFFIGNGLILTNYHVLEGGKTFKVVLNNGKEYSAEGVVKFDKAKDLAILKTKAPLAANPMRIGSKEMLKIGDPVIAIGSPVGLKNTISEGIVSGFRKEDGMDKIQTTTPITYGSSGGVLFNNKGYIVGVTSSGYDIASANLNFAIPINYATAWINELKPKAFQAIAALTTNNISDSAAIAVLNAAIEASRQENIKAYMALIDEDNFMYEFMGDILKEIFKAYDLSYELKDVAVIERTFDSVYVRFTQITKKVAGAEAYEDNEETAVLVLKESGGKLKIYNTIGERIVHLSTGKVETINGFGKLYDEEGRVVYEGNILYGQQHGQGKSFDENGNVIYEGRWEYGEPV